MIENCIGHMLEFDMQRAKKLSHVLDEYTMRNPDWLPPDLRELVTSVWGYDAAITEIADLRRQLCRK